MRPVDPSGQRRSRPAGLLLFVALLMLAGCQGYGSRPNDPFLGVYSPPKPVTPAAATAANRTPPLPASAEVPSQAALASGTKPVPYNPRDLRIRTPPVVPVSSSNGAPPSVPPNGVRVGGPVPIPESTSKTLPAPVASSGTKPPSGTTALPPPPNGNTMTFKEALQYLKNKGVVWQRLDGDQGRWKFQCSLPIPGNAHMNRTYETQPPLPSDPLSAVRAVVEAVEKDGKEKTQKPSRAR